MVHNNKNTLERYVNSLIGTPFEIAQEDFYNNNIEYRIAKWNGIYNISTAHLNYYRINIVVRNLSFKESL